MHPQQSALRRGEKRQDARRSILAAATELLRRDGPDGLTMRRVAASSGCSAPTLYHYFRDKTALLEALLDGAFAELVKELERLPTFSDPLAALRAQCLAVVRFCLSNPTHFRLMSEARPDGSAPLPSHARAISYIDGPLLLLSETGRLRVSLDVATQTLWTMMHGLISLQASRPDLPWLPDLPSASLDVVFSGIVHPAKKSQ